MSLFTRIFSPIFWRRRDLYRDLAEEMREHLEEKTEQFVREGMSRGDAEHAARRAFGNATVIEEHGREVWQWPRLESIWADVRYALRQLRKSPGFTATAVLTLALGIGANTAIFSVIDTILLRPLPYADPDRLVLVSESLGGDDVGVSAQEYLDYRRENRVFSQVAAFESDGFNLTGNGQPLRVNAARISASALPLLGAAPEVGRNFADEEDRYGANRVVLLSHELWQSHYAGDPGIVGNTIRLDEKPYTVIGIMPPSFRFPFDGAPPSERARLWLPIAFAPNVLDPANRTMEFGVGLIGRLKDGVTPQQAREDVDGIASRFMQQYDYSGTIRVAPQVHLFAAHAIGKARPLLILLAACVACVLLIACANVANLLLVRASARGQEMALRAAIGANRFRLLRQCLVESILLSLFGAAAGVVLAIVLVPGLKHFGPANIPRLQDVALHPVALLFTLMVSLVTSVVFGFAPAWRLARVAPQPSMWPALQVGINHSSQRLQNGIATAEIALAVVLLVAGGLLLRSFARLLNAPMGFDPENTFVVRTLFDHARYRDSLQREAAQKELLDRLSRLPGIAAVAEASHLPLSDTRRIGIRLEHSGPSDYYWAENSLISPGYFAAMGIALRGRDFTPEDRRGSLPVAIVSETFARQFFPGKNPVGQRVQWGDRPLFSIIGVTADVHISALDTDPPPMIYTSIFQVDTGADGRTAFVLRGESAGRELSAAIMLPEFRERIWSLDKELPVYDATTLQGLVSESLAERRFTLVLLGSFAVSAVLLAVIGIFGVISNLVVQRQREFGVRIALGANRATIAKLVLGRASVVAIAGVASGLLLSVLASRLLLASLYHTSQYDPVVLCLIPTVLLAVVLAAAWLPARRAAGVDPMQALRSE
jgi:predicted permease